MQVCFVGFGSIAKRHIKNLKELYNDEIEIDILRSFNRNEIPLEYKKIVRNVYLDYRQINNIYDVIFITNPTQLHYDTLQKMKNYANNFFVEKPAFVTGDENITELQLSSEKKVYVACPLRYTNTIQYVKKNIDLSKVYAVRCISSSYLPEWRTGTDYRTTYSAKKNLGGGVAIDLIHEWDYLCYLLGFPNRVQTMQGKKSSLEIDSEDIAIYIAEYANYLVELHLDYFGRKSIRKMEMFCEDDTIEIDLIDQKIIYRNSERVIDLYEDRDSYQKKELNHFFEIIRNECQNDNDLEHACRTIRITRGKY